MEQKTILITGGAGFIGSHLVEKYLDEGHKVICLDNLQTTRTPKNIQRFLSHERFVFVRHDVINPYTSKERIDWIFNFACSGSYTSYQYDPIHTMKTSTQGVINMLELARTHGARIMQASTSEIYGDPLEVPQRESYKGNVNSLGPRACYDEGKRSAETLCMDYHREYGTDVKIIRIFNTYGPNMDQNDGRAVTNFLVNALHGKDIVIYGDGSATRSFQYIDDLVRGIDLMMRKDDFIGPVNLGNPGEITMKELAEKAIALTSSPSRIIYDRAPTDDPQRRCPDITLADVKLGWKPRVSLDEGLQKTIAYFKSLPRPDATVLVFATYFNPEGGPAESAFEHMARSMGNTDLHIVSTRLARKTSVQSSYGRHTISRVGVGSRLDAYLFPFLAPITALRLHRKNRYTFVWSTMGSYSAYAALLLTFLAPDLISVVTLERSDLLSEGTLRRRIATFVRRRADAVIAPTDADEAHLRGARNIVRYDGTMESLARTMSTVGTELQNKRERKLARPK